MKELVHGGRADKQLPGLIHFYAGVSRDGTMMEAVGVKFTPIATYPVSWTI